MTLMDIVDTTTDGENSMHYIAEHLTRQSSIIPLETLSIQVNIIGVGAIGSFTALALAKMGIENISIWDNDVVSIENMNSQFYPFESIGEPKVNVLKEMIKKITGVEIDVKHRKWTNKEDHLTGIIISAVDSMSVRKELWEKQKRSIYTKMLIDPRMAAEHVTIYTMNPLSPKDQSYENTLYSDDDAVQERCTAKATIYTSLLASGLICKIVKDIIVPSITTYPRITIWQISSNDLDISSIGEK